MHIDMLCATPPSCAWDLVAVASAQAALLDHEAETMCWGWESKELSFWQVWGPPVTTLAASIASSSYEKRKSHLFNSLLSRGFCHSQPNQVLIHMALLNLLRSLAIILRTGESFGKILSIRVCVTWSVFYFVKSTWLHWAEGRQCKSSGDQLGGSRYWWEITKRQWLLLES